MYFFKENWIECYIVGRAEEDQKLKMYPTALHHTLCFRQLQMLVILSILPPFCQVDLNLFWGANIQNEDHPTGIPARALRRYKHLKEFGKSRRMTVVARNWNESNLLTINNLWGMSVKINGNKSNASDSCRNFVWSPTGGTWSCHVTTGVNCRFFV